MVGCLPLRSPLVRTPSARLYVAIWILIDYHFLKPKEWEHIMAIYHFSGTIISRSQGRSAVACAAYRSAEKLVDERYKKTHDYTHKQDVAFTEILLPENAPTSMQDREKLWNMVEAIEKRKDDSLRVNLILHCLAN